MPMKRDGLDCLVLLIVKSRSIAESAAQGLRRLISERGVTHGHKLPMSNRHTRLGQGAHGRM